MASQEEKRKKSSQTASGAGSSQTPGWMEDVGSYDPEKNTLLDYFRKVRRTFRGEGKWPALIHATARINALLLAQMGQDPEGERSEKLKEEACEVVGWMLDHYSMEELEEHWLNEWPEGPLIWRIYESAVYEESLEEARESFFSLPEKIRLQIERFLLDLNDLPGQKDIYCVTDMESIQCILPEDLTDEEFEQDQLLFLGAHLGEFITQKQDCGITIHSYSKGKMADTIMGVRIRDGKVEMISVPELKWSYSHDALTGKPISVPKGFRFKVCPSKAFQTEIA